MPETTTAKRLAAGTLTTTLSDLYVVPSTNPTTVRVTHLRITATTAATVTLKHHDGTTGHNLLSSFPISANSYEDIFDLMLSPGDKLEGNTTSVTDCDYLVYGLETETT
ncbi:hypothetical protein [Crocosphaera sp.]|uniref:hypothetical protein n=1 Tax=Crocosphaera sp. TaxID=2729996 RepID=UPI002623D6D2|nr:hypothetical protein [Crocosphaera sp.]MDJ0579106.1 hypothetical protein [Crocosphaera sp.]